LARSGRGDFDSVEPEGFFLHRKIDAKMCGDTLAETAAENPQARSWD
jgi:hypothetical protein